MLVAQNKYMILSVMYVTV